MNKRFAHYISRSYSRHADKYVSILEPTLAPMAAEMARMTDLEPGQRALDLATGTGLIARALEESSAVVMGADFSLGILALAQGRSQGAIHLAASDAHWLPFGDGCFDVVTCSLSLSHFSEIETALEEVFRVLLPGGGLIASAWGTKKHNPTKEAAGVVRGKYIADRETAFGGALNEDQWADVETGRRSLERAGFADIEATTSTLSGRYADHAAAAEAALAWPITRYQVAQLPVGEQDKLKEETEAAVRDVSDLSWWIEVNIYRGNRPRDK